MSSEAKARGERFLATLQSVPLRIHDNSLKFTERGEQPLTVHYYSKGKEETGEGDYFVELNDQLVENMKGSYLSPDQFVESLEGKPKFNGWKEKLLGSYLGKFGSLAFFSKTKNLTLNVFHGSTNKEALSISKLAAQDPNNENNRLQYQNRLSTIINPVVKAPSNSPLRIVEDCLASGDTIIGVIKTLAEKTKLSNLGTITIDVAVASTQGILLLKKFAEDNNIKLELNLGYVAFGLSDGEKAPVGYDGANYITYPEELVDELTTLFPDRVGELNELRKYNYVVGDMGEFAKRIPTFAKVAKWEQYRVDSHGQGGQDIDRLPKFNDKVGQHLLYLTNGGYLMRAYYNYFNNPDGEKELSEIVFSAKRRWTKEFNYGVLLKDVPKEIIN